MSEHFGNDYDAYFKILEENLEKSRLNKTKLEQNTSKASKKAPTTRIRHTKRRKKSRNSFGVMKIALSLCLVVAVIWGACFVIDVFIDRGKTASQSPADDTTKTEEKIPEDIKTSFEFTAKTTEIPASNDAKTAIIVDLQTGEVVAQRGAKEKAYPASTTKIMTLLTAVDLIEDFSDTFTMSYEITDPLYVEEASVAGFLDGEKVSMTDLLYGMILPSGADAAMGLAVKLAGSEEAFVELMNKKVEDLGLSDTHFSNVSGLHSEQNYSTAYDMAIILDAALKNELCKTVLSTYLYTTAKTPQNPDGILLSSTLFTYMYGTEPEIATILGGKTGYVNESGYCIASYGSNNENGNQYIVVTFGNSARMPAFFGQIDLYKEFAK